MELQHERSKQLQGKKVGFYVSAAFFFGMGTAALFTSGESNSVVVVFTLLSLILLMCAEKIKSHTLLIEDYNKRAETNTLFRKDLDRLTQYDLLEILLPGWFWEKKKTGSLLVEMTRPGVGLSELGQKAVQLMIEKASEADRIKMHTDSKVTLFNMRGLVGKRDFTHEEFEAIYLATEMIARLEAFENRRNKLDFSQHSEYFIAKRRNELIKTTVDT
jgi:hypothetical protein